MRKQGCGRADDAAQESRATRSHLKLPVLFQRLTQPPTHAASTTRRATQGKADRWRPGRPIRPSIRRRAWRRARRPRSSPTWPSSIPTAQEARPHGGGRRRSRSRRATADRQPGRGRHQGRRAAPLRLERLQLVPVPERAASARRAALPDRAGAALLQHPHPRHQARSEEAQAGQDRQGGGARRAGGLLAAAHGALRAGRDLRQRARQRRGQGPGRRVRDGPRDVRRARPLGGRPRAAALRLRHVVAPRPRHGGDQRVGHPRHGRGRADPGEDPRRPVRPPAAFLGPAPSASTCRRSTSATSTSWCSSCARRTTRPRPMASSTACCRSRTCRRRSGPGTATATSGRSRR